MLLHVNCRTKFSLNIRRFLREQLINVHINGDEAAITTSRLSVQPTAFVRKCCTRCFCVKPRPPVLCSSTDKDKSHSRFEPNYACIAIKFLLKHINARSRSLILIRYLRLVNSLLYRFGTINIDKAPRSQRAGNGKGQYQLDLLETITTAPLVWHSWNHADSCKYFYQNVSLQSGVCARWGLWKCCGKGYAAMTTTLNITWTRIFFYAGNGWLWWSSAQSIIR